MMVVAAVLSGLSFASVAAQQVSSTPLDQQKIGVISAKGRTMQVVAARGRSDAERLCACIAGLI